MMATTNATYALGGQAPVQPLEGRVVAPREPLRGRPDSFELDAVLDAGRLQAASSTRAWVGPSLRGGRMLVAVFVKGQATISEVGTL